MDVIHDEKKFNFNIFFCFSYYKKKRTNFSFFFPTQMGCHVQGKESPEDQFKSIQTKLNF